MEQATTRPTGEVTFLFTDIEGSTALWELYPDAMRISLAQHDEIIRSHLEENGGYIFKTVGDQFCSTFANPVAALRAALKIQNGLRNSNWSIPTPIFVRIAIHSGHAVEQNGDYFGQPLNRVARLLSIGNGQQIILSKATRDLISEVLPAEMSVQFLGSHRLKDLQLPEEVFQLNHPDLPCDFPELRSLGFRRHNIPIQMTSFVGRGDALEQLRDILSANRMVTLIGAGGVGKTRLAIQIAGETVSDYDDGIWVVELAAVFDPAQFIPAIAHTLGVREDVGKHLDELVIDYLRSKRMLLILDNCEHLIFTVAQFAQSALTSSQYLSILATSREALTIPGEAVWRVPSLLIPDMRFPKGVVSLQDLMSYESIQLFVERARSVKPEFELTHENALTVVQICQRLDGIPLAIELAAVRLRMMSVETILQRLSDRFRLLSGGTRTALPRHQTLRATIDWSCDLLEPSERTLFARLSVFSGPWTLEAAEKVCAGGNVEQWDVMDTLSRLVDKSLVVHEESLGETSYRMLETIRLYSAEKLLEIGEVSKLRDLHVAYYAEFCKSLETQIQGPDQKVWLNRADLSHENIRAALRWCAVDQGKAEIALIMVGELWRFWYLRGYFAEGRETTISALSLATSASPQSRAKAYNGAGVLTMNQADYRSANAYYDEALTLMRDIDDPAILGATYNGLGLIQWYQGYLDGAVKTLSKSLEYKRKAGDDSGVGLTLNNLGNVELARGDMDEASAKYKEALRLFQNAGNPGGAAMSLSNLGIVAKKLGQFEQAIARFTESLKLFREIQGVRGMCHSMANAAIVSIRIGELDRARAWLQESLNLRVEAGDLQGIAESFEGFGSLAVTYQYWNKAAIFLGFAESLRENIGAPITESGIEEYLLDIEAIKLADGQYKETNWQLGREIQLNDAIAMAMDCFPT